MPNEELQTQVRSVVVEATGLGTELVTDSATFGPDLGIDSLTRMDILTRIEETFAVDFPDEEIDELQSVDVIAASIVSLRS
jgi:acyl carrier protein